MICHCFQREANTHRKQKTSARGKEGTPTIPALNSRPIWAQGRGFGEQTPRETEKGVIPGKARTAVRMHRCCSRLPAFLFPLLVKIKSYYVPRF